MEFDQIITLIKTISDSKVTSFTYEKDDKKICIKTGDQIKKQEVHMMPPMPMAPQMSMTPSMPMAPQAQIISQPVEAQSESHQEDSNLKVITSPLVGTFYSASSPEDEPFVKVGDVIKKGQKLGIIEAMKLMNDIESDYDGEIVEVMVTNENMVEYGQPLFKIK